VLKNIFEHIWLRLFAHRRLARINHYRLSLAQKSLGINNYMSDAISGESYWCQLMLQQFKPSVIFDIGAHKGDYAKMFRQHGYAGKIYLFEPHPETFKVLSQHISADEATSLFNIGFSDTAGSHLLFDHAGDSGSPHATLFSSVITDLHGSEHASSVAVELQTVDQFAAVNKIDRISLLKIDTEGNEYKILLGASKLLQENRIDIIQFEFGEMNVASRIFFKDFYDLLSGQYHLYRLLPNDLLPLEPYNARRHEIFIYQNIIAVNRKMYP
jgi:FkbM family methyltransferase